MHSRLLASASLCLAAATGLACGGDDGGPRIPAAIVIVPNHPTLGQGLSLPLTVTVVDASGRALLFERPVMSSSDTAVATVTDDGLVTSKGPIQIVRITADLDGLTNWVDLQVTQRIVGLAVNPPSLVLNTTSSTYLSVFISDFQGNPVYFPPGVHFASSDPTIATVDQSGLVSSPGAKKGNTTITVTADTLSATVPVKVTQIPTTLDVAPQNVVLSPGGSQQLTTTVRDAVGQPIAGVTVHYSTVASVFTVSASGLVSSIGANGSGTITVTGDTLTKQVGVFVGNAPAGTIVKTTSVPGPAYAAAVSSGGTTLVSLVSTSTAVTGTASSYEFTDTLAVGFNPVGVAINPAGTTGYVAILDERTVAVIDLTSGAVTKPITGAFGGSIYSVAVSPDGQWLFCGTDAKVYKVRLSTYEIVDSTAAMVAVHLAVHPTQPLLYASPGSNGVVEINTANMASTRSFLGASYAQAVAVALDGSMLYLADEGALTLKSFSLSTGSPGVSFTTVAGSFGLVVTQDLLCTAEALGGHVECFDRVSGVRFFDVFTGGTARRPAYDPVNKVLIVPNEGGWVDFIK